MKMFENILNCIIQGVKRSIEDRKRTSLNAMRILAICEKINEELQQKQKIYVLIQLMDFISSGEEVTENNDFLQTVADAFINRAEYQNIKSFVMEAVDAVPDKKRILIIDNIKGFGYSEAKHINDDNVNGAICFLQISSTNTYTMRYSGKEDLYLNGQNILARETYIFDHGSSIRGSGIIDLLYGSGKHYIRSII
jgi:hypothetical protein